MNSARLIVYTLEGSNDKFLLLYPPGKEKQAKNYATRWRTRKNLLESGPVNDIAHRVERAKDQKTDSEQTSLENINLTKLHQELFGKT